MKPSYSHPEGISQEMTLNIQPYQVAQKMLPVFG
jgi:hypothetical protein